MLSCGEYWGVSFGLQDTCCRDNGRPLYLSKRNHFLEPLTPLSISFHVNFRLLFGISYAVYFRILYRDSDSFVFRCTLSRLYSLLFHGSLGSHCCCCCSHRRRRVLFYKNLNWMGYPPRKLLLKSWKEFCGYLWPPNS